ncbi:MAG: hypothetical protein ABI378_11130 [Chitinophagaceae bacterium]
MNRRLKLGLLILLTFCGHIALAYFTKRNESLQLFGLFGGLFLIYLLFVKEKWSSKELKWLLAGSLALRLLWVFSVPQLSDDWARFVWDGRLSAAGFNPFIHLPSELIKGGLPGSNVADLALYNALNSQHYFTVYPPVLQGMFAFASWLSPDSIYWNVVVLKSFIFLGECGTISLLIKICNRWKLSPNKALLYALNPLVIAELCGNVHHEGVVLFFVLAAIYSLDKLYGIKKHNQETPTSTALPLNTWFWLAAISFSASVDTKLLPLVFVPLIFFWMGFRRGLPFFLISACLFLLSWFPFVNKELVFHAGSSMGLYFNHFEFNGSVYFVFSKLLVPYKYKELIAPLLGLCSGILILLYSLKSMKGFTAADFPKHFCIILGIYFAFAAVVHPWYIVPLIGLSVFSNLKFPVIWSVMIVGSYYTYRSLPYEVSNVQLLLEYFILIAAILWDISLQREPQKKPLNKSEPKL